MAEKYDKNGYTSSDFKRNSNQDMKQENQRDQDGEEAPMNEKAGEYMRELLSEKIKLSSGKFPLSTRLLDQEVTKVQANGRVPPNDSKYVDVYRDKVVKVVVKVLVPVKDHPKFNFVGKLLGPKGNTLKQLQEETMCKMAVLGRGSVRDRQKEEELRNSLDPKYAHLSDELHVEISALAPPAEAHARIAYALAEVKKYLIPDPNDIIRQSQLREMSEREVGLGPVSGPGSGRRALLDGPDGRPKNIMYSACTVTKRSFSYRDPIHSTEPEVSNVRPPPRMVQASQQMRGPPAKTKVLSILDRARTAMETSYSYEEPYSVPEPVRVAPRSAAPPTIFTTSARRIGFTRTTAITRRNAITSRRAKLAIAARRATTSIPAGHPTRAPTSRSESSKNRDEREMASASNLVEHLNKFKLLLNFGLHFLTSANAVIIIVIFYRLY